MTSGGEMSAARTTTAKGLVMSDEAGPEDWDLRSDFTTSLTPRRRVFDFAAKGDVSMDYNAE